MTTGASTTGSHPAVMIEGSVDAEQLVERRALDVASRQMLAELGRAPHGDDRERLPVGEVEALDAQHLIGRERLAHPPVGAHEGELEDLTLGLDPALGQLALDGDELAERLAQRSSACERCRRSRVYPSKW